MNAHISVPFPHNEPVRPYDYGSPEQKQLLDAYARLYSEHRDVPHYVGSEEIRTGDKVSLSPPHDHQHVIGHYYTGDSNVVHQAIDAALCAAEQWQALHWRHRVSIFLRAAELIAGPYRDTINAATMLAQSKSIHQAEIEAACEFADFLRFNAHYMMQIYADQPTHSPQPLWNVLEYRPLEGFVYAITPFNFTAIAGNLPAAPALMGNVVVWKPSPSQIYSADVVMEIFKKAGLPDGVINMINTDAVETTDIITQHPQMAGIHFTGSTHVFKSIWKQVGNRIDTYRTYPRLVGETGGKDFIWSDPTTDIDVLATAIIRGGFEYQGQKCSAASRVYVPESLWSALRTRLEADVSRISVGSPDDPSHFMNAVIHEASFDKLAHYISRAKESDKADIVIGGTYDKSKGYFVSPTIILTTDPTYETMTTELFGPVVTIYVYPDAEWEASLSLVNDCPYALTGAIFSKDRYVLDHATKALRDAAGNFYINDKPTGAVVGQQPFGGARASGTNDKAGSYLNLLRWASPRIMKENLCPDTDFAYPFMKK